LRFTLDSHRGRFSFRAHFHLWLNLYRFFPIDLNFYFLSIPTTRDTFKKYSMLINKKSARAIFSLLAILAFFTHTQAQQKISKLDQAQAKEILLQVKNLLVENYYDPTFHGYDLDARFKAADEKFADVNSFEMAMNVIGWTVQGLADSHTHFVPPPRNVLVYSGWRMEMIGPICMISAVEPNSDAWKQGLRPGDQVLKVEDYQPTRSTFSQIKYIFTALAPLAQYHFVVASPAQSPRSVTTKSRLITIPLTRMPGATTRQQVSRVLEGDWSLQRTRAVEVNEKLMIWKLPAFRLPESEIKHQVSAATKHETLILDLRDNSGGSENDLRWMIGSFFDHDITVGQMIERGNSEPLSAPSLGKQAFTGKLIVLVNASSASAAEIFARTVQLQKRGTVVGDQTAGSVGRGKPFLLHQGTVSSVVYSMEITVARLKMPDGGDLEGKGVTPDIKVVPTSMDLAQQRDPALTTAAQLAGIHISPEEAAKMFPVVWPTY
jgi:C-terminal processing protease CtpA/Prc